MKKINEKARDWRNKKDLTLAEAASILELSTTYVWELENERKGFTTHVIKKYLAADPKSFKPADFYQ